MCSCSKKILELLRQLRKKGTFSSTDASCADKAEVFNCTSSIADDGDRFHVRGGVSHSHIIVIPL